MKREEGIRLNNFKTNNGDEVRISLLEKFVLECEQEDPKVLFCKKVIGT